MHAGKQGQAQVLGKIWNYSLVTFPDGTQLQKTCWPIVCHCIKNLQRISVIVCIRTSRKRGVSNRSSCILESAQTEFFATLVNPTTKES